MNSDGNCTPCVQRNLDNGCYMCDYVDPTKCLLCRQGYYQINNGNCVLWDTDKNTDQPKENTDKPDTTAKNYPIILTLYLLYLALY